MITPNDVLDSVDRWQRKHRRVAIGYGVLKKFSDDHANLLVVALGWYGFTAIYPLLLVVVVIFGYIGVASLGTSIVHTLHQFPVIGQQFNYAHGGKDLHGSILGLVIGILGLLYGAQGVTQVAEQAMATAWNLPPQDRLGFLPRLGRSVGALVIIGGSFVVNALVGTIATGSGHTLVLRVPVIAGLVLLNVGLYLAAFRVLTPKLISTRDLVPGAVVAAVAFTLLITVGTGLLTHELEHESSTYGAFASVIGTVTFLLLLAKVTLYAAELNPILRRQLFPRSLRGAPTEGDRKVWALLESQERHVVKNGPPAAGEPAAEASA